MILNKPTCSYYIVHNQQFTHAELSWYVIDANGRALVSWPPGFSIVLCQENTLLATNKPDLPE